MKGRNATTEEKKQVNQIMTAIAMLLEEVEADPGVAVAALMVLSTKLCVRSLNTDQDISNMFTQYLEMARADFEEETTIH